MGLNELLAMTVTESLTGSLTGSLSISPSVPLSLSTGLVISSTMPITDGAALTGASSITLSTENDAMLVLIPTPTPESTPTPEPVSVSTPSPGPDIAPTPDGAPRTVQVPILMYHYVSIPPADADIYRKDLSIAPADFASHLDRLQADGYTTISLYDFAAHLAQGSVLPEKPVIISFDDGYRDNYTNAFPALAERNMTAMFFVVTDFIDEERPAYFSWDMLREMRAGGMHIESHGRNHVTLKGQNADYLVWQALGSMETIEYELGKRPRFISYPAGEYDQSTIDIFNSAGYWAGLTTVQGATHDSNNLFELRRVRVRGTTTPDELSRLLALDW